MYTSGTTGDPKGAILTHANFVASQAALVFQLKYSPLDHTDVHLSYLPLAHIFERLVLMVMLAKGASVGFFRGNILWLLEDIALLRPTVFPSVPRLLNRIYDKLNAAIQSLPPLRRRIFETAYAAKRANLYANGANIHPFWYASFFSIFLIFLIFSRYSQFLLFFPITLICHGSFHS
jgi:long-chain acyl-CoA synthetase